MGGDVGRRRGGGRGLQVRVVTAAGHRDLVIAPPLPDPGRLVASLVAAAPDATLLIPARLSLHLARYFWDGLSPVITPATDVLTLSDFRRPGVANPVGRRDRLS